GVAPPLPAEPLEEPDVGRLHVGQHLVASQGGGGLDGEADQRAAQVPGPEGGQDRQPVALPDARFERVEAHGAAGPVAGGGQHLDGGRRGVVAVAIGAGEDALLDHEDGVTYPMVNALVGRAAHRPADDLRPRHQPASTVTGINRRAGGADWRSSTPSAEPAWHRAQPAFAPAAPMPRAWR